MLCTDISPGMAEDFGAPVIWDFDHKGLTLAQLLRCFNGVRIRVAVCHDFGFVFRESHPAIGLGFSQDPDSFFGGHHAYS